MGSRAATACWPRLRFVLLLLTPLVGLSVVFIRAFGPSGPFWSPRKLLGGTGMREFPIVNSITNCCTTFNIPSLARDSRGWLLDPISVASRAQIFGAVTDCKLVHVGEVKAEKVRGNHRHLLSNETLIVWGAEAKFRVENPLAAKSYTETWIRVDEVGVLGCPAGRAHALINMDSVKTLYLVGCQDGLADPSNTEYNVWTNLR